tara:strand:- start:416 stop:547 length:132 start_codon:yes stop_codon:yes gene_type:complete
MNEKTEEYYPSGKHGLIFSKFEHYKTILIMSLLMKTRLNLNKL